MIRFLLLILFFTVSCTKNIAQDFNVKGKPVLIEEFVTDAIEKDGKIVASDYFNAGLYSSELDYNTIGHEFEEKYNLGIFYPFYSLLTFDNEGLATAKFRELSLSELETNLTFYYDDKKLNEIDVITVYSPTHRRNSTVKFEYSKNGNLKFRNEVQNQDNNIRTEYEYDENNKLSSLKKYDDNQLVNVEKFKYSDNKIINNYTSIKENYTVQTVSLFNKDGNLISTEFDGSKTEFKYDDKKLMEFTSENEGKTETIRNQYEKFDEKGNWTRKIIFSNNKPMYIVIRKFKY